MHFPFKQFLILLMLLVLPVQAFASSAKLDCAFSHQGPSSAPKMAMQMAMLDGASSLCHALEQSDAKPAQNDCKHCAMCYMASALPIPSIFVPPTAPLSHSVIVTLAPSSFIGFIPDSPERPPRTVSA